MNLFDLFQTRVATVIGRLIDRGDLPAGLDLSRVVVEPPRDPSHGDLATNAAMALAKDAGTNPRALAELISGELAREPGVVSVAIAGPGFLNLRLDPALFRDVIRAALRDPAGFGRSTRGKGTKVNVEYVSANPTGPMHVGHGRGAVFGDALANLLAAAGYDVTREYYINDAGAQVDVLARSAYQRYLEACGCPFEIKEGYYPGEYLIPVGRKLFELYGHALKDAEFNYYMPILRRFAVECMMAMIIDDLHAIGIKFDVFYSERSLYYNTYTKVTNNINNMIIYFDDADAAVFNNNHDVVSPMISALVEYFEEKSNVNFKLNAGFTTPTEQSYIKHVVNSLRHDGLIYEGRLPPPKGQPIEDWEDREQTLFRSTQFGDDVDRPLLKSDGSYTYFASDIAYHKSKFDRGFAEMIDVWGADHGGYVKRMQAAVAAVTGGQGRLDVKLCQLVKLMRDGEPVKMSKRAGDFVTLREVIDELNEEGGDGRGRDAVRFMMLFRKNDATLDFDLAKVLEQSKDNPVFYVQYAHARVMSVFKQALEAMPDLDTGADALAGADLALLADESEIDLVQRIAQYPREIDAAARAHEPHRIAFYLHDLASAFHSLWNKGKDLPQLRFVNHADRQSTLARLALLGALRAVLSSGLGILGVSAPSEMR